jgi:hypothetical protein
MDMISVTFHHINLEIGLIRNVKQDLLHVFINLLICQQFLAILTAKDNMHLEEKFAVGITFVFFLFLCHFFTSETLLYYIR